jgi:hypothetical protein
VRPWTPTTEMVRRLYVAGREATSPAETLRMRPDDIGAEFDRWFAEAVRRASRDDGGATEGGTTAGGARPR